MKKFVYTIIILGAFCCSNAKECKPVIQNIDSILISHSDWYLMTDCDVSCMNFEVDFASKIRRYKIKDRRIINNLHDMLRNLQPSRRQTMDVRCKIYFYSSDSVRTACMDRGYMFMEGYFFKLSQEIKNYIDSIVCKEDYEEKHTVVQERRVENIMIAGKDTLRRYLKKAADSLYKIPDIPDTIELKGFCRMDIMGNTTVVNVLIKNKTKEKTVINPVINHIMELYKNEIKWQPNKERLPFDFVPINLTFVFRKNEEEIQHQ